MVKNRLFGSFSDRGPRRKDRQRTVELQWSRRELIRVQHSRCPYCDRPLNFWNSSIDHVWPITLDGYDGTGNWVACHVDCNSRKGNRLPRLCELLYLFAVNDALGVETRVKRIGKEYDR